MEACLSDRSTDPLMGRIHMPVLRGDISKTNILAFLRYDLDNNYIY